jgi:hypothetical protein
VAGRLETFQDAAEQLLGLKPRRNFIKTTSTASKLQLLGPVGITFKEGTIINAVANVDPSHGPTRALILSIAAADALNLWAPINLDFPAPAANLGSALLNVNLAPDFIEDKGHTYGNDLSEDEKRALIEYLKTL